MKKRILFFSLILCVALIGGYFIGTIDITKEVSIASEDDLNNTITVTGEGVIKISPDVAYINIGVETRNKDSKIAQLENSKKMDLIMKQIKKEGIDEKFIKTIEYNIYTDRRYNNDLRKDEIIGYVVRNVLEITVTDIDNVGKIIDLVSDLGANYITNIRFGTLKQDEYYLEALKLAMENSKSKASTIAKSIDVKLDKPYRIIENSSNSNPIMYDYGINNYKAALEGNFNTPISQGELKIKAVVSVIYKY